MQSITPLLSDEHSIPELYQIPSETLSEVRHEHHPGLPGTYLNDTGLCVIALTTEFFEMIVQALIFVRSAAQDVH